MNVIERKKCKAQAHTLKPVVIVGQAGLTEAVLAEIDIALDTHELIKIKIRAEREDRVSISAKICQTTGAELIQSIGQIIVIHRINLKK
ncbi:MAG: YhbY family RNA-binding protein [Methylovulum sp.]|nr:YhbY family RNA-binding protein [Methylovulum sp.]